MKSQVSILLIAVFLFITVFARAQDTIQDGDLPKLTGPYLGQKPPENEPLLFAPGFISTAFGELNPVFAHNGKEFYFSRRGIAGKLSALMTTKLTDREWTAPELVNFSGTHDDIDLFISPDGHSMIFCSAEVQYKDGRVFFNHDFWISNRNGNKWDQPIPFAEEAISEFEDYFPVVTQSGNLYFNSQRGGPGTNDIYCSKFVNGKYNTPEKLPAPVNTQYREFDAFLSQDENMIVYSSDKPGGFGQSDIYISYKNNDGKWSDPENLGNKINSEFSEYGAHITPDGKYLFFTSNRNGTEDIFWVSAKMGYTITPSDTILH